MNVDLAPIGALQTEDESGPDERFVCISADDLQPVHGDARPILLERITHIFGHDKDFETGRWVRVQRRAEQIGTHLGDFSAGRGAYHFS